jgi:DNA-binding LacI/PurR family transcriptional regulator
VPGASPESRQRVLQAADELGYRPDARARLLRSNRSRLLGVVFGVQHAFHGDLVGGLYRAADSRLARLSHVALTTVAQDAGRISTLAVTRAIERLESTRRPAGAGHRPPPRGPEHHRTARYRFGCPRRARRDRADVLGCRGAPT